MVDKTRFTLDEAHLHFAKSLNGETWNLLDKENRTTDDNELMLAAAFASHYHWLHAGKEVHRQRGEYMIARVYLAVGNWQEALSHATRCLELTDQFKGQMEDFDVAFAYEMAARTNAANGLLDLARRYRDMARKASDQIKNNEDRDIFLADLNGGNWFNL
jgi:tetratricopeptide (TPR) repeat protein